ncbi:acyltransferase family protein [Mucilaginibacter psychrotolerans]|uniref:Acyltransferase n=1 Tax=Mucilaginibacter psychrotolerans TaxID=1524096 RepID=A0A4Y8SCJ7_9SPHI|nr:acyltransferase family protein [Mucilaginibacter psychrotolerans]TFF36154.1 acyltransferase [Mucilaginibacter psychrotolerans]
MGKIRFLLALSVITAHCGPILGLELLSAEAVQAFFVISGFYMALVLNEKYIGANWSYKLFITNRYLRVAPVYWAVLVLTILFSFVVGVYRNWIMWPILSSYQMVNPGFVSFGYLILTNIFIFGQDLVVLLGIDPASGELFFTTNFWNTNPPLYSFLFLPQAWTLGLELSFYLIAPFLLRKGFVRVVLFMTISVAVRLLVFFYFGLRNDPWSYRFFPSELFFFLLGYFSYRIYLFIKNKSTPRYINLALLYLLLAFTVTFSFLP